MTVGTQASALASYGYTLGATGNRTAVTELGGTTVNYTYDDLYRLTNESITNDPHGVNGSVSYGYDSVGNRLNRISTVAPITSQSSTYDLNDRLTSDGYDNNGNTTAANGNNYAYDFENRLTSLNGGTVRYVYDGDGRRVAKIFAGVTTNYLVDSNNPTGYSQVVEELQGGAVVKTYTYGHDLISQKIGGGSVNFYQYDGTGSVRVLTNAAGAITDAYDYDAFGNLIYRSGTTPNDFLYTGQQFDSNIGFYYLRARYLDPSSGRFISMDSFEGNSYDPLSLHKYSYTGNDPVNKWDKSGNFSTTQMVGIAVVAIIAAIAILPFATHYLSSGRSNDPPIEIEGQPVILNNSGWSGGVAELALARAADIWNKLARIVVKPQRTIYINQDCDGPGCLRNYLNRAIPNMDRLNGIMTANNVTAKHWTFFIASPDYNTPGATDMNHWPRPIYLGVDALNDGGSTSGALTLAHEWGHSFGLHHKWVPNLMIFGPLAFYGLQESLTASQRQTARAGAAAFR